MAIRSEFANRQREARVSVFGRLASRLFTRKTTGLDGFVKRQLAKRAPSVEPDPELARVADEMRGRTGKVV
jgi:hypothetical protein